MQRGYLAGVPRGVLSGLQRPCGRSRVPIRDRDGFTRRFVRRRRARHRAVRCEDGMRRRVTRQTRVRLPFGRPRTRSGSRRSSPTDDGFKVHAALARESAKDLNRELLSELRRDEKKTRAVRMEGGWGAREVLRLCAEGASRLGSSRSVGTSPARMELHFNYYREGEIVTKRGGGRRLTVLGDP